MNLALLIGFVDALDGSIERSLSRSSAAAGFARLTTSQLRYVNATSEVGAAGPAAVAAHLGVSKASATVAINRLVALKLVSKKPSASDKRAVSLKLTASGRALMNAKHRALADFATRVSSVIGPKEVARLEAIVAKLIAKGAR
jgi:DNA-binding MarR family transcriptional regulator